MPLLSLSTTALVVAAMPENQRREYVRVLLLTHFNPDTEETIVRALPARSAAACRLLFRHLREWK